MKTIYICGSQSTGKTTLCESLEKRNRYNHGPWVYVKEAAREVIKDDHIDFSSFKTDLDAANRFQREVWKRQKDKYRGYKSFNRHGNGMQTYGRTSNEVYLRTTIIVDRGPDALVYSSMFATIANDLFQDSQEFIAHFKEPNTYIFILDPHEEMLQDDGVRHSLTMENAWRFTHNLIFMCDLLGIPYVRIQTPVLLERVKLIESVVR